jgi:hypothetical protein
MSIAHIQQPYAMTWNTGQKAWIHNLHHQHNCDEWMGCSPVKGGLYFAMYSNDWTYQHNTYVDGVGHDESTGVNAPTAYVTGYPTQQIGAHFFRSNILHKQQGGSNGLFNIAAHTSTTTCEVMGVPLHGGEQGPCRTCSPVPADQHVHLEVRLDVEPVLRQRPAT